MLNVASILVIIAAICAAWTTFQCGRLVYICFNKGMFCTHFCRITCVLGAIGVLAGLGFIFLQYLWLTTHTGVLPDFEDIFWSLVEIGYMLVAAHMTRKMATKFNRC